MPAERMHAPFHERNCDEIEELHVEVGGRDNRHALEYAVFARCKCQAVRIRVSGWTANMAEAMLQARADTG
jgi:hypothetical protein